MEMEMQLAADERVVELLVGNGDRESDIEALGLRGTAVRRFHDAGSAARADDEAPIVMAEVLRPIGQTMGELSRRLADLVRKETCAEIARTIDLGSAIRLGASEANAGGRTRPAILADVCEALIGAVYLDGGFSAAEALVGRLWETRMRTTAQPLRDPKTVLQEWAQARGLPTPAYREVARSGPDHDPEFRVAVQLPKLAPAEGTGRSKRAAEQAAAAAMMEREGVKPERADG